MARGKKQKPKAKDRVVVTWVDIYDQGHEDPARSQLKKFSTVCYFVGWRGRGRETRQLVTSSTIDCETGEFYGCCSYPAGTVLSVEVV